MTVSPSSRPDGAESSQGASVHQGQGPSVSDTARTGNCGKRARSRVVCGIVQQACSVNHSSSYNALPRSRRSGAAQRRMHQKGWAVALQARLDRRARWLTAVHGAGPKFGSSWHLLRGMGPGSSSMGPARRHVELGSRSDIVSGQTQQVGWSVSRQGRRTQGAAVSGGGIRARGPACPTQRRWGSAVSRLSQL